MTIALRTWADDDPHDAPTTARLAIRTPPDWEHVGVVNLTHRTQQRILGLLRRDIAEQHPGPTSPQRAAAIIDGLLAEHRAAGRTHIRATDLVSAAPRIGRSRAWIAEHITRLVDAGYLQETWRPGRFRL
ncbi:hypothetical protein [Streptomyces sp. URMC 124]|uniref:hypothetical protein n=1 Tax=Streptomyces sp. URMC 124 TaxID=3423405 RepID=UPI003F52934B